MSELKREGWWQTKGKEIWENTRAATDEEEEAFQRWMDCHPEYLEEIMDDEGNPTGCVSPSAEAYDAYADVVLRTTVVLAQHYLGG